MLETTAMIVGCGRVAGALDGSAGAPSASHALAYSQAPGVRLDACVDVVIERARALARKYRASSFGADLSEALRRHSPDVVSVCTPDDTHFEVARRVLSAARPPKVLFLEKPVCATRTQFKSLASLSSARGVVVLVNHSRRFDRRYQKLRAAIAADRFGRLVRADALYYGGWRHNGAHAVDTLRFLFPGRVRLERAGARWPSRHRGDPTRDAELSMAGGARAYLHGFDEARYQVFDFDFMFERARLRVENFESAWAFWRRARVGPENVLLPAKLELGAPGPSPIENAVSLIARYLRSGDRKPLAPFTLEAAQGTMEVLWSAR